MISTVAGPVTDTAFDLKLKLLLARLLFSPKRPLPVNNIRKGLGRILGSEPSTETMQDWIDRLCARELIDEKRNLTEAGRREALEFLGLDTIPPKANWTTITNQYLVPIALGIDPKDRTKQKKLSRKENLEALLLKRRFSLPANTGESLSKVFEAIVCRELGYPEESTLKGVQARKLEELSNSPKQLTAEQARNLVPTKLLNTGNSGISAFRDLVLREWAGSLANPKAPHSDDATPVPLDQDMFARTVLAVARDCPTGWFGDNKVFVNHVYRYLIRESAFMDMSLDEFKRSLVEANRANRLTLSRADLVSVMDAEDVRESETRQLDAIFHFILVQKERP